MEKKDMMRVETEQTTTWTLSADRKTVGVAVPPLKLTGKAEAIRAYMDFDATAIDAMLNRLTMLRSQMLPPLPAPAKRN